MILIDALRHFDVCCLKVLEYYIHKSKVPALISCYTHGNQPSALTTEPSRRLTDQERKHPLVSALPDRTKTQLTNLCSALSGAKEHNLGHAADTRMINKKIWDFQTPPHVSPISSARILENLVESLPPDDRIPVGNQIEGFTASFNGHPHQDVAVQTKLEVAENAANKGGEYPTLSTFAKSIESLGVAKALILPKPPPKSKKSKKSNSSPPETANSTQTGGRGSGRKGGKGTGDGGGGGTGKGEKGGPRRAVNCYYCKSPVARTPSPGECGGPSSCKWRHHFESLQALLIETNGQLPPVSRGHAQRSRCTKGVSSGEVAVSPPPSHSERFGRFLQLRD